MHAHKKSLNLLAHRQLAEEIEVPNTVMINGKSKELSYSVARKPKIH